MEYRFHHLENADHCHEHTHEHASGHEHSHEHTHEYTHSHAHTHDHGHEHDHQHEHHEHTHDHAHDCDPAACKTCAGGCNKELTPADKTVALLTYMVDHNRHHVMELEELSESITGEANAKIAEAIEIFCQANEKLAEALRAMVR